MKTLLARILCSAAHSMWQKNPTLGHYTGETFQHELNLQFHYAVELLNWFPWLDCDFDVAKRNMNRERPDIVFHKRKTHLFNFLVIEIKREQSRDAVPEDLKQIRNRWFKGGLRYHFGAAVILEDDKPEFEVQVMSRQDADINPEILKHSKMGAPLNCQTAGFVSLKEKVGFLLSSEQAGDEAAIRELMPQLGALIFQCYDGAPNEIKLVNKVAAK